MRIQDLHIQLTRDLVPIFVALTKFDQAVAIEGGSFARDNARTRIEQPCRSLFRRELSDVPVEIVSGTCFLVSGICSPLTIACIRSEITIQGSH